VIRVPRALIALLFAAVFVFSMAFTASNTAVADQDDCCTFYSSPGCDLSYGTWQHMIGGEWFCDCDPVPDTLCYNLCVLCH